MLSPVQCLKKSNDGAFGRLLFMHSTAEGMEKMKKREKQAAWSKRSRQRLF